MNKSLILDRNIGNIYKSAKGKIKLFVKQFENSKSNNGVGVLDYNPIYISENFVVYKAVVCKLENCPQAICCSMQHSYFICNHRNFIVYGEYTANKDSGLIQSNINSLEVLDVNHSNTIKFSAEKQQELEFAKAAIKANQNSQEHIR